MQDNLLTELPQDLSGLRLLANLNLNGNQFENFKETVESLKTLPHLKSVYLNLYQEEQVDYIMRTLNNLDFLNGLKVEREILDDESSVTENDSPGNKIHNTESPAMQIVERRGTG
jgi:Leucine-rich repeat (LRR) protein